MVAMRLKECVEENERNEGERERWMMSQVKTDRAGERERQGTTSTLQENYRKVNKGVQSKVYE